MNIMMISGEANPFVKTGGLADVVYSLSQSLASKGHDVSIVLPFYKKIKDKLQYEAELVSTFPVYMSWRVQYCGVFKYHYEGISYYFIDNEQYFYRDSLYGFDDDTERFAYFDLAVVELIAHLNLKLDIIHVHDWQAGMIPLLLKTDYRLKVNDYEPKFVLTIHNPAFQGKFDPYYLGDYFNLSQTYYDNGTVRFDNCASFLKSAIVMCDKITTVSPTHARELLEGNHAYGLETIIRLREHDFVGILNGLDYEEFNPETDKYISPNYNIDTAYKAKRENKEDICREYGFKDPSLPLFGVVSRLTSQKGIALILDIVPILSGRANVIILGCGQRELEDRATFLSRCYAENVGVCLSYNNPLAHKIYAASDFFLMPSEFEPCGISQMICHRYGTLPIVRHTGGLIDTVNGYDNKNLEFADGFHFEEYSVQALIHPCFTALEVYRDIEKYLVMQENAMRREHTWDNSSEEYLNLYREITGKAN